MRVAMVPEGLLYLMAAVENGTLLSMQAYFT
jgi:hypothetical protein